MSELQELTHELVSIPSHSDETAAGDYIEAWLEAETSARVTRDSHGNVIARRGNGSNSLAFVGHHDVVSPDSSQKTDDGYLVQRRDGRLYGRGSADMKGALAALLCAFRDVELPGGELVFASFVDEETGGAGARGAIDDGFSPEYAVVGEGSTGYSAAGMTDVAVAHKGRRASTVTAMGSAAHASEPEAGENAIYRATDAVEEIRAMEPPETTVLGHELTGSVVVTEIEGGSAWNVVPDECTITVDERTVPSERAELHRLSSIPGVTVTTEQDLPPMACADSEFASLVLDAAKSAHSGNKKPASVVKPHATDAGWLAAAGTNCVVCGPAEPGEAHTASESVSLDVLDRCYEIYHTVASEYSRRKV